MQTPNPDQSPLDHNGECLYCDEPASTLAAHAVDCPWRIAVLKRRQSVNGRPPKRKKKR